LQSPDAASLDSTGEQMGGFWDTVLGWGWTHSGQPGAGEQFTWHGPVVAGAVVAVMVLVPLALYVRRTCRRGP
jgi:hypothetical protein